MKEYYLGAYDTNTGIRLCGGIIHVNDSRGNRDEMEAICKAKRKVLEKYALPNFQKRFGLSEAQFWKMHKAGVISPEDNFEIRIEKVIIK